MVILEGFFFFLLDYKWILSVFFLIGETEIRWAEWH